MNFDLQNYTINIISFIFFVIVCLFFLYQKKLKKNSDDGEREKSIEGLNFQIHLLKKEI